MFYISNNLIFQMNIRSYIYKLNFMLKRLCKLKYCIYFKINIFEDVSDLKELYNIYFNIKKIINGKIIYDNL